MRLEQWLCHFKCLELKQKKKKGMMIDKSKTFGFDPEWFRECLFICFQVQFS